MKGEGRGKEGRGWCGGRELKAQSKEIILCRVKT